MKKPHILAVAGLLTLLAAVPSFADDSYIVRLKTSGIDTLALQYGLKVKANLGESSGNTWVVGVPEGPLGSMIANALKSSPLVQNVEHNDTVGVPELSSASSGGHKVPGMKSWTGNNSIPSPLAPWSAYLNQPAVGIIRLQDAQRKFGYGGGRVAVIDTGVDFTHPALFSVTDPGWDFTTGSVLTPTAGTDLNQETTPMVDQETTPMVDGSGTIILNQETTPMVDQETTPMVDASSTLAPCSGHGTMMAGVVHLVAPNARILPLKAFSGDCTGKIADVISAIYYAVKAGVTVINASFDTPGNSPELQAAIAFAAAHNVIVVAAAGNNSSNVMVYPAGDNPTITVAATTNNDYLSSYSNFGSWVDLGAPGDAVLTTYPRNRYALGWGTSPATAWVSGTAALIKSVNPSASISDVTEALKEGAHHAMSPGLGAGRLDVFKTVNSAKD